MRFLRVGLFVLAATRVALSAPVFRGGDSNGALDGLYPHNPAIARNLAVFPRGGGKFGGLKSGSGRQYTTPGKFGRSKPKSSKRKNKSPKNDGKRRRPVSQNDDNPESQDSLTSRSNEFRRTLGEPPILPQEHIHGHPQSTQ